MRPVGERIVELLRGSPLVDGHNDLLWAMREAKDEGRALDLAGPWPELCTDLPRLARGGVGAQFWSVFVPCDFRGHDAVTATLEQIDALHTLVDAHPDRLEFARTASDVKRIADAGRVASMIGVEGGHSIGGSLGVLRTMARLGAGYLTLTHNEDTDWADSATGKHPHGGLTAFGEEVVRELNRSGVLVDLSHVSDDTMRQAIEVSRVPVIFSHSSARALADAPRNVPDDVLELVGRTGGVVMVTFVPDFLTRDGAAMNALGWEEARRLEEVHPEDPKKVADLMEEWFKEHATPADVADVADHVDHVREIAGVQAIGVGSDFDGVPNVPQGLEDVSKYPDLFEELASRGYTDQELMAIAGRNVLRVMREAERAAEV
jgi:membrane dipeptidase